MIATVVISYKRHELLRQTLESYLETVTLPYRLLVVDNGGSQAALDVASELGVETIQLQRNMFPGFSTNTGWDALVEHDVTYLHRSDNDVEYLPGWCDEIEERFTENPNLGQLGLRTLKEEGAYRNVGGNCVVTPQVFTDVRWNEGPWQRGKPTEDYYFTLAVQKAGWDWERVLEPCIVHLGTGTPQQEPYYAETWASKGYGGY